MIIQDAAFIADSLGRFIVEHGPWTGHRIHLGYGVHTCNDFHEYCLSYRTHLYSLLLRDFGYSDISGLRILDLACHEGAFSIEFARQGAVVVGIDGRESSIARAAWAASMMGLECQFRVEDVRNLRSQGPFDVVLCAGILYHLTAQDAVLTMRQIAETGCGLVIIDTHVAPSAIEENPFRLSELDTATVDGQAYEGRWYPEFPAGVSDESKMRDYTGSALDNEHSFWFRPADLRRMVEGCGFRVYEAVPEKHTAATFVGRL